jgi:hypothetical protein
VEEEGEREEGERVFLGETMYRTKALRSAYLWGGERECVRMGWCGEDCGRRRNFEGWSTQEGVEVAGGEGMEEKERRGGGDGVCVLQSDEGCRDEDEAGEGH